jgi:hypothetical protein
MKHSIVVSRFNEDIEWTKNLNVIIYNKGEPLNIPNEIILKNVGREGHTIYTHISKNYDNLNDYTTFLQGNPFDHSPNLLANLHIMKDFFYLSEKLVFTTLKSEHMWLHSQPIYDVFETVFGKKATMEDENIFFGAGAQFTVSKERILNRPRSFYENIVKLLEYDINPIEGHPIERLHSNIFKLTNNENIFLGVGSHFMVLKERIHKDTILS